jgi:hypothetical protein
MPIVATNNSQPRELIPAGNYVARCYSMLELGTIPENYMGETKHLRKVRISWELPTETKTFDDKKGPQPLAISQEYTLSMNEKSNLRKMLASWRGKDFTEEEAKAFDITKLLGKPCMLNIIHKPGKADPSKIYEQIAGVTSVPKGFSVPEQVNASVELYYDKFDEEVFNGLPDFLKDKMKTSQEYQAMKQPGTRNMVGEPAGIGEADDLPF